MIDDMAHAARLQERHERYAHAGDDSDAMQEAAERAHGGYRQWLEYQHKAEQERKLRRGLIWLSMRIKRNLRRSAGK